MRLEDTRREQVLPRHRVLVSRGELRLLVERVVAAVDENREKDDLRARKPFSLERGREETLLVLDRRRPGLSDFDHEARLKLRSRVSHPRPHLLPERDDAFGEDPNRQCDHLMKDLDVGLREKRKKDQLRSLGRSTGERDVQSRP